MAQIQFEDVSAETGMTGYTETWGASWGDINGDNWPDLFNQGHREYPRMFRNTGEGGFQDIAYQVDPGNWITFPYDDKHGASWADYDNDGDDDMLLAVSATGPGQFLINTDGNGSFIDRAVDADIDEDEAARLGVWFDYNNDGHLDILLGHTKNIYLRLRDPDDATHPDVDFDEAAWLTGFNCTGKLNYAQLIDLDGAGKLEILCMQEGVFPIGAFDYTSLPHTNVTGSLPFLSNINDTVVADFNGDLLTDMVMTRGAMRPSGATLTGTNHIEAWLRKDDDAPIGKGLTFESPGEITVTIDWRNVCIYCNSDVYVLDPVNTPSLVLTRERSESPLGSLIFEWDAGATLWRISMVDDDKSVQAYLQIDTVEPVTNLTEVAFDPPEFAHTTTHLENGPGGLTRVYDSGLSVPVFCVSAAAGDFDNDMDQDLYLVCRRGVDNLTNRMYVNQGDGSFVEMTGHGAEGPVGTGLELGLGESVVTADYDVDGFLDLYVTNGLLFYPINSGGPEQLFRNIGSISNNNHWLEIDLAGTASNRDGVGAKIYVTAGGVTQLREQNGGYHRWSQNDQRLHIGLGTNTSADVTIEWPSGAVDNFTAVAADTLYVATENGSITPAVLGPPVYTQLQAGDECGEPPYNYDYGPAVLLWKNCTTGVWSLRAKGGRFENQPLRTDGEIIADTPFSQVAEFSLGGSDLLDNTVPETLEFGVGTWFTNDKGFDFSTAGQATACLNFSVQDIPTLIVGGSKKKITGGIDLVTLTPCTNIPPPPLDLPECGDPLINNATENGLFAWRDCDFTSTSAARWHFTISGGGAAWGPYSGLIESDAVISAVGTDIEPNDTLDSVIGDTQIDFTLNVGGTGIDSFRVDMPNNVQTCLDTDLLPPGTPVLVGENRMPMSGNIELVPLGDCNNVCHP